jgi:hypothetical protein
MVNEKYCIKVLMSSENSEGEKARIMEEEIVDSAIRQFASSQRLHCESVFGP